MKLPADLVGTVAPPVVHEVDARWLMAYAAALGEAGPCLDTGRPDGPAAHPLFPVAYEWPALLAVRDAVPAEIAARAVHSAHDLRLHRPPRAGDRLASTATVLAVQPRRAGAFVLTRVDTRDAAGLLVTTTDYGTLYRDVACDPAGREPADTPRADLPAGVTGTAPAWTAAVPVAATLAHVYTECARIWNPIHTDRAAARAAGLPDIILHGTATLALAVSAVLRNEPGAEPIRVRRIVGRFGAMMLLPSTLAVEGLGGVDRPDGRWVAFRARTAAGAPALRDAALLLAP